MTITREIAETELVSRAGKRMALVDMSTTVESGTQNSDLNSPLAFSLRKLGLTASVPTVTDSDLAAVEDSQIDELFDRAELRLLNNILGNSDFTTWTTGPRSESVSNLTKELEAAIQRKEAMIIRTYGDGSTLEYGNIVQNFQESMEDL